MVPHIQELTLQLEPELFMDRYRFGDGHVLVESMRTMQVDNVANRSRRRVGRDVLRVCTLPGRNVLRIDQVRVVLARYTMHPDRLLQLRRGNASQRNAAVPIVIEGRVASV